MGKIKRENYEEITNQQINFLRKSCLEFDKGNEDEGIRIAGHLRTILHDSHIKKDFDIKLSKIIEDLKEMVSNEAKFKSKKMNVSFLNKITGLQKKIEHQQKIQITATSLLTQIGKKDIKIIDTSTVPNSFSFFTINKLVNTTVINRQYYGLLAKEVNVENNIEKVKYSALCYHNGFKNYQENCNWLDFEDWWHKIIFDNADGVRFSRKDLVLIIANKEGFAHIEDSIDIGYKKFQEANVLEDFFNSNIKQIENKPTIHSVRQIAFEVIESIKKAKIIE